MWMLERYPSQHFNPVPLPSHFLCQLLTLWLLVTIEATKLAAHGDHTHPHPLEMGLLLLDVPRGDDQDALGRLREVSPHS